MSAVSNLHKTSSHTLPGYVPPELTSQVLKEDHW